MQDREKSDGDKFLYKYRTMDDKFHAKKIFTDNELYFARADQFNDPFDCRFDISFDASDRERKDFLETLFDKQWPGSSGDKKQCWIGEKLKIIDGTHSEFSQQLKQDYEMEKLNIGIFSLTRVPNNILMWSHYADSHKGFCIKFLDDKNEIFIARAQPIIYSNEYPIINQITDNKNSLLEKSWLTKSKHWEYEKEWRIIDYEKGPGVWCFPPHLLVGVIFGCRMCESDKVKIRKWCGYRQTKVSFYQAVEASDTYSLDFMEA